MNGTEIGVLVAGILTLIVFSYLVADNPLYRLAEHIFIGASLGWVTVLLYQNVILGRLFFPLRDDPVGNLPLILPLILGVMLLSRLFVGPRWFSSAPLGLIVGVGVALAIVGSLTGMLIPQILGTARPLLAQEGHANGWFEVVSGLIVVLGVLATVISFRFTRSRFLIEMNWMNRLVAVGRYTVLIAFGAFFASLAISRVSLLVGRMSFLVNDWLKVFS